MKKEEYLLYVFLLILLCSGCDNRNTRDQDQETIIANNNPNKNLPVPARGKLVDPDSLSQPKTVLLLRKPKVVPARNNVFTAEPPTILSGSDYPAIIIPGENGVPLPDTISVIQEAVPVRHPRPVPAKPMTMKTEAITDIQYLSVSQGLKSPFIRGLLEDRRGSLWIVNGHNLSRYDGQHFIHYTSKDGIDLNNVSSMMEDSRGDLWLGGWHGLSRYDGKQNTNYSFEGESTDVGSASRPLHTVNSMMEDRKGKLWFGTWHGIYCFDPSVDSDRARFVKWTPREGLINRVVYSILEDREGNLWFGTRFGLSRYDGKQFTNYLIETGLSNDDNDIRTNIRSMMEDSQGVLWLGTDLGLIRFDPSANAGRGSFANMNIIVEDIRGMTEDDKGNIWVCDYINGLYCLFRDETDIGKSYAHYTQKEGLNGRSYRAFLKDRQGNIWIGGQNGGVSRINIRNPIQYYNQEDGLKGVNVNCVFEDSRGNIWMGESFVALKYDPANGGALTKYGAEEGLDLNEPITSIMEDQQGNVWFGTWRGLIRLNLSKQSRLPALSSASNESFTYFDTESGLSNIRVLSMHKDKRGNLWFGNNQDVTYYEPDYWGSGNGRFFHYPLEDGNGINGSDLQEDRAGNLWIATTDSGRVLKLDLNLSDYKINVTEPDAPKAFGKTSDLQRWMEGQTHTAYSTQDGLSNDNVQDIMEDSRGMLWFATLDGLSRFDPGEARFYRYGAEEGLLSDNLRAMAEDQQNRLWILSQSGINVVVSDRSSAFTSQSSGRNDYQFYTFSEADGIYTEDGGFKTLLVTSQNQLWWSTGNGVASLDLNNFELPADTPKINLNSIEIDQTYVDFSGFQDTAYQEGSPLTERLVSSFDSVAAFNNYPLNPALPHDLNHLTFHYSAIDWSAPHQLQYSYLMEGMDENWSELSPETKADYRNLAPGNYTFKVKAMGAAKKWSEVLEYPFKVRPPWWQTWWAYVVYGLLFIGALIAADRYQRKRLLRIEREKAQLKELDHAKEIEKAYDNLKSTQAQLVQSEKMASLGELTAGIAHEIQNPLNFVNNFSDVSTELIEEAVEELEKNEIEEVKEILSDLKSNLEKISHHGGRASGIVKGMLEHSRTSKGEKVPTDINALCDEYLRLAYHGLRAKDNTFNAAFETDFDDSLPKINVIPQDIGRVLLNILNNAFYSVNERSKANAQPLTPERNLAQKTKYIPLVTVSTRQLGSPPFGGQGECVVAVSDNGIGMSQETIDKVFQPFFTTKPTGQGTGLGMSISYDIITKGHRGELKVESTEGKGTVIQVMLPIGGLEP